MSVKRTDRQTDRHDWWTTDHTDSQPDILTDREQSLINILPLFFLRDARRRQNKRIKNKTPKKMDWPECLHVSITITPERFWEKKLERRRTEATQQTGPRPSRSGFPGNARKKCSIRRTATGNSSRNFRAVKGYPVPVGHLYKIPYMVFVGSASWIRLRPLVIYGFCFCWK